jgi:hypothetical protein
MHKHFPKISVVIGGVKTVVEGYAFEDEILIPIQDRIFIGNGNPMSGLRNCLVGRTGGIPLICSAVVNSKKKGEQLVCLAKQICQVPCKVLRLSCTQTCALEFEGEDIQRQHLALFQTNKEFRESAIVSHLIFPLEDRESKRFQKIIEAYEKILKLLNMEAWVHYCAWYQERIEEVFAHFFYGSTDEYTLEGYAESFRHEVFSDFLERTRFRLEELQLAQIKQHFDYQELLAREKEMIMLRGELEQMIKAHYENLVKIVRTIQAIEEVYPHLTPLRRIGQVLESLLANQAFGVPINWGTAQMLLHILNDELGVISAVNGQEGCARISLAFSLRLTISQMKQRYSNEEIIDLLLNEVATAKESNTMQAQGVERFNQWMRTNRLKTHNKRILLLEELRANFVENMVHFSFPMIYSSPGKTEYKKLKEALLPLYFLPFHLVEVNSHSGEPLSLTEAGHRLMDPLL